MTATLPNETQTASLDQDRAAANNIFEKAVALNLRIGCLGTTKKLPTSKIEVDCDKDLVAASKKILACKELEAIKTRQRAVGAQIRNLCLPSLFRAGIYLVPIASLAEIDQMLLEAQQDLEGFLVPAFLEVYTSMIEADKIRLRSNFVESQYLPLKRVQEQFYFDWAYVNFGVPTTLQGVDGDLFKREQQKAAAQIQEAATEIQALLRAEMLKLVAHLADTLTGKEDGKKKIFRDTTVTNVKEFLDTFTNKNIVDDKELETICAQAKALLAGVDPDALRKQDVVRDRVRAGFETIKTQLDTMVTARPSRMIVFKDSEGE